MSILQSSPSWNVGRASGRCVACHAELPPDTSCWAALCDGVPLQYSQPAESKAGKGSGDAAGTSPFLRVDFCEACWTQGKRPEHLPLESLGVSSAREPSAPRVTMFSYWKTTVPVPQQKRKLLVDDAVLMDVFNRMQDRCEPQEIRFRFVLALILMRKRLLKYEGTEQGSTGAPAQRDVQPAPDCAQDQSGEVPPVPEIWRMLPRLAQGGWGAPLTVVNPHLTADQISEVSQQLSAILAEEI